jgi:hypothetical protein
MSGGIPLATALIEHLCGFGREAAKAHYHNKNNAPGGEGVR